MFVNGKHTYQYAVSSGVMRRNGTHDGPAIAANGTNQVSFKKRTARLEVYGTRQESAHACDIALIGQRRDRYIYGYTRSETLTADLTVLIRHNPASTSSAVVHTQ